MKKLMIHLRDDGSVTVVGPEAAAWCQQHNKFIRIVVGDSPDAYGVAFGGSLPAGATFEDFQFFPFPPGAIGEPNGQEEGKLPARRQ